MRQRCDFSTLHNGSSPLMERHHRDGAANMGVARKTHGLNLRVWMIALVLIVGAALSGNHINSAVAESGGPSAAPPAAQAQGNPQAGQPAATQPPSAAAEKESVPPFRPRLPAYYGRVVDEKQRQKIYDIQRKYHAQIAELQRQLEKLIAQRDAEIEAVLTPEQKAEIQKMREGAAARRSNNAASQGEKSATPSAQP